MRWTPLLLAVACTHTQPTPAPLSTPAQNALGPAEIADGGTLDGGSPDAGQPRTEARDAGADLVSPITAAGSETPVGLDWGEKGQQPASTLFKNVKLFGALTGDRMMAGMQSMRANLGQKCAMCHLVEQKDFASDAKKEKVRAREMIRMSEEINRRTFEGKTQVTCWMCHRAEEEPAKRPFSKELPPGFAERMKDRLAEPAEKVFKDVRILARVAAKAAVDLLHGKTPKTTGTVVTKGRSKEPAYLIAPQAITKANYKTLFTSGFMKKSDVCNGDYAQYC